MGVSETEIVPATTVQIFTGNSIAPRGDMASRSFIVSLNVDRPDPENRAFTHADPSAWTQANREKILRALYTILLGGVLQRPQGQVAKTRFKTWWGLIGWPVEYAAGLLGSFFVVRNNRTHFRELQRHVMGREGSTLPALLKNDKHTR